MAGARVLIDVEDARVRAALKRATGAMDDTSPLMADISEYLYNSTRERFDTQTDPQGERWPALHPRYLETKPRNRDKILTLTGEMRGPRLFPQSSEREAIVADNAPQAAVHNFGGVIKPKYGRALRIGSSGKLVSAVRIPKRQFIGLSDDDGDEVVAITVDYLGQSLEG